MASDPQYLVLKMAAIESSADDSTRVLDAFLRDMQELDSQQSVPLAHRSAPDKRRAKSPSKGARLKRKEELVRLRRQSEEMETRVVYLKLQRERRRQQPQGQSRWRLSATREQERLQTAQDENEILQGQLRTYLRRLNAMQETVTAVVSHIKAASPGSSYRSGRQDPRPKLHVAQVGDPFSDLKVRMEARTLYVHGIIEELQQCSAVVDALQVKMLDGDGDTAPSMIYESTGLLPFDAVATCNAAWNIFEASGISGKQFSRVIKCEKDAYAVESRFTLLHSSDEVVSVDIHCLVKQCAVLEGVILLVEANTRWSDQRGDSLSWTHESRVSAYFAARHQEVGCQVRVAMQSQAVDRHSSSHKLAMASYHELLTSQRQFVENLLWDSARIGRLKGLQRGPYMAGSVL